MKVSDNDNDKDKKCPFATHVLYLKCAQCSVVDLVFCKDACTWSCKSCKFLKQINEDFMSSPQNVLYSLEYEVKNLCKLLQGELHDEESRGNLIERLDILESKMDVLIYSKETMENLMKSIIKLLESK